MSNLWRGLSAWTDDDSGAWVVDSAHGSRLRFQDGTEAVCLASGLWNAILGYDVPGLGARVAAALEGCSSASLFRRSNTWAERAAEDLVDFFGSDDWAGLHWANGGASANDAVLKYLRYREAALHPQGLVERDLVVVVEGSYHGLTYGAMSMSGDALHQTVYGVDRSRIRLVRRDDSRGLDRLMRRQGERVAAVVVEPVLGTGVHELPADFIATVLELRSQYGFAVVADEVATGFHRVDGRLASDSWSERPDVVVVSKALTNGTFPCAAILFSHAERDRVRDAGLPFLQGETQAGSPPVMAAVQYCLERFRSDEFRERVDAGRTLWRNALAQLVAHHPGVELRGKGLFWAVSCDRLQFHGEPFNAVRAVAELRDRGLVLHPGPGCLQVVPSTAVTDEEATSAMEILSDFLSGLEVRS